MLTHRRRRVHEAELALAIVAADPDRASPVCLRAGANLGQ